MPNQESDVRELREAHRKSAEKVRTLLEELEAAEKEFAHLTDKVRALNQTPNVRKEFSSTSSPS